MTDCGLGQGSVGKKGCKDGVEPEAGGGAL